TAVNGIGDSGASGEASATPTAGPTAPDAPQGLHASPGSGTVDLTWSAPGFDGGSPITGYRLYRGTNSNNRSYSVDVGDVLSYPVARHGRRGQRFLRGRWAHEWQGLLRSGQRREPGRRRRALGGSVDHAVLRPCRPCRAAESRGDGRESGGHVAMVRSRIGRWQPGRKLHDLSRDVAKQPGGPDRRFEVAVPLRWRGDERGDVLLRRRGGERGRDGT